MKPSFSFSDALSAPFALLKRRPLCVLVWGLMMVAVIVATYSLILPLLMALPLTEQGPEAVEPLMMEMSRFSAAINGMNLIMYLVMLALWTAAARATLSPGRGDRFLFLRLGMDELRVAVAIVAVFVGWYIALVILILLGVGIGLALWQVDQTVAISALVIYGLIVLGASVWVLVRASLIAPATLILKRFAFVEGWALTKGQVWKLIGLNVVLYLIYLVAIILTYALVGGILVAGFIGQGLAWPSEVTALADLMPVVRGLVVPAVLAILPLAFGMGWVMTLYVAPMIVAARQLLDGAPIVRDTPTAHRLELP